MAEQSYTVDRQDDDAGGRYSIRLAPETEAEMTYRRTGANVIAVDHTFTPPAFRGRDIAFLMMQRLIDDARIQGNKVLPLCSYAVAQFRRHPEWEDLLAD